MQDIIQVEEEITHRIFPNKPPVRLLNLRTFTETSILQKQGSDDKENSVMTSIYNMWHNVTPYSMVYFLYNKALQQ